jgi:hypothetical protein
LWVVRMFSAYTSRIRFSLHQPTVHAGKRKKLRPTARELSVLSIYFVPNYLPPLPAQLSDARPECVTALSETTAFKLAREQWPAFAAWNMGQCTRVYPRQLRIDSSNFDPQVVWDVGVAMVGLIKVIDLMVDVLRLLNQPTGRPKLANSRRRNAAQPRPLPRQRQLGLRAQTRTPPPSASRKPPPHSTFANMAPQNPSDKRTTPPSSLG